MPVSRKDVALYGHDLDRFYRCLTKQPYFAILVATRAAYLLSEIRGREYEPYTCIYCKDYHIGRINRVRRPE
jgi:hypothetical protein